MDGWVRWVIGCSGGWLNGWMDGWTDGRVEVTYYGSMEGSTDDGVIFILFSST